MVTMQDNILAKEHIWDLLGDVVDPEIPVVSLVEMGIIRQVIVEEGHVVVIMTPTFSGCPALDVMEDDIKHRLAEAGVPSVEVVQQFDPPWTSNWISASAREKLKGIGLAPPHFHKGDFIEILIDPVICPYCDSTQTTLKNSFGPTPCRMIYYCNACQQPFEQFKPL
jgi:ring-1,2-phenylacetyl-CoA epoxidase subunit PaaD